MTVPVVALVALLTVLASPVAADPLAVELVTKPVDQYRQVAVPLPGLTFPHMEDDLHLRAPLAAGERVYVGVWLRVYGQGATADFKLGFSVPPGALTFWTPVSGLHQGGSGGIVASNEHLTGTAQGWNTGRSPTGSEGVRHVYVWGVVVNGPTAGEVAVAWAPGTLSTEWIGVLEHSCLVVIRDAP